MSQIIDPLFGAAGDEEDAEAWEDLIEAT